MGKETTGDVRALREKKQKQVNEVNKDKKVVKEPQFKSSFSLDLFPFLFSLQDESSRQSVSHSILQTVNLH